MSARRRPNVRFAWAAFVLGIASIPVPGLLGAALGLAAVAFGGIYVVQYLRASR